MEQFIVTGVALAATLLVYGVLSVLFSDERAVARRLKEMTEYEAGQVREAQPLLNSFSTRVLWPTLRSAVHFVTSAAPVERSRVVRQRIESAGSPGGLTPVAFYAIKMAIASATFIVAVVVAVFVAPSLLAGAVISFAGGAVGFLAPNLWLRSRVDARKAEIRRELPDMLDMLTISVEAGLGFDAALAKYVKNGTGPLSEEFSRALQEIQAGVTRRETLRRLGRRTDVSDLTSFISSMVQADILGTSVAHVLRTQSAEMRLRRRQRAEEAAQKLPVKLVFPVVLCILPATIIAVMGPAVVRLMGLFGG